MKLVGAILTVCAAASCSVTDLQVRPTKAKRLAEDFRNVCLAHPRDDAGVRQAAAERGIPVMTVARPGARDLDRSVSLSHWRNGQAWSCLMSERDEEIMVTARSLAEALQEWPDGQAVQWGMPERGARQMPLLQFASRRVGQDMQEVRTNRLRGNLVYYFEVVAD